MFPIHVIIRAVITHITYLKKEILITCIIDVCGIYDEMACPDRSIKQDNFHLVNFTGIVQMILSLELIIFITDRCSLTKHNYFSISEQ